LADRQLAILPAPKYGPGNVLKGGGGTNAHGLPPSPKTGGEGKCPTYRTTSQVFASFGGGGNPRAKKVGQLPP